MAIDIKQLHFGSHVLVKGNRVRVRALPSHKIGYLANKPCEPLRFARAGNVEPIPITPDLLKELGFEYRKDSSCWRKYQNYNGVRYGWVIYAYGCDGGTWCFSLYLPLIKPQLYAKCLHELEGQLAYYGVELIKD